MVIHSKNVTFGQENEGKDGMNHTAVGSKNILGNSLMSQGLGLHASTAGDPGSIPGLGTHIPHPTCHVEHPKRNLLLKTQNIAYFASL